MMTAKLPFLLLTMALCTIGKAQNHGINWTEMSPKTFEKAAAENKIILLNLEANWCHWCHVMHDSTYTNPAVIAYINQHFIPVKADQDAHPELSIRYKNYGWPATIFINAKGEDVVKRAGYISPKYFLMLLKAIVADPSPERGNVAKGELKNYDGSDAKLLNELQENYISTLDIELGGFNQAQKFVSWETFEYALFQGKTADEKTWVKNSISGAKKLSDPAWGGIYQYSTHYGWEHLHYEKLLAIQARYVKIFAYAEVYLSDKNAQNYADDILNYANRFLLRPNGLYANAQDADLIPGEHADDYFALGDAERLKRGTPKVDTNTYTQRNAEFAQALLKYSYVKNTVENVAAAQRIAQKLAARKAANGLYFHAHEKREIWSLKDQIAVAEMWIEFVKSDAKNKKYTAQLADLMAALKREYITKNGAAKSFVGENGLAPNPLVLENIKLARLFNWYAAFAKKEAFKLAAENMYQYLINPAVAEDYYSEPELLLLKNELTTEPAQIIHINKGGASSALLCAKAMAPFYSLIFSYTPENLPVDKKALFPEVETDVIFICTSSYCSSPLENDRDVEAFIRR